ncbi:MAG: hypothetical protein RJA81_148, partial [Planctomycetota bacterium]
LVKFWKDLPEAILLVNRERKQRGLPTYL